MKKPSQPPKIKDKNESLLLKNEKKPLSSSSSPSTSSSSSSISPNPNDTVPVPKKITRDLPNLSECHACGFRTDTANPNPRRQRLQTLRSEWRIVLLCNKCFLRVNSSHICSYCFLQADHSSFRCRLCNRRVHSHCFHNNRHVAPWSYSSSDEFSVCVDCWVPKPIARSRSRSRSQSQNNFKGNSDESSRVLPDLNSLKSLQDAANDASSVAKNKTEVAVKAREEAVRKALLARKAVELANGALDLVASDANNKEEEEEDGVFIDDVELAFRLHRVMNSSPRISSNFCSLNTSCLAIIPRSAASGNPSVCGKLQLCSDNKLCENPDKSVSEPSVCVRENSNGDDTTMDSANLSSGNECKPTTTTTAPKDRYRFKYCRYKPATLPKDRYRIKYCRCKPATVPKDRYQFKYCRFKPARPKDRYRVKYCRRNFRLNDGKQSKFSCDGFHLVNEGSASAPGLVTTCSNESVTISDATLRCCVVPLRASACASDSFQDQSSRQ